MFFGIEYACRSIRIWFVGISQFTADFIALRQTINKVLLVL